MRCGVGNHGVFGAKTLPKISRNAARADGYFFISKIQSMSILVKIPLLAEECEVLHDGKKCKAVTTNINSDKQLFDVHYINPDTGKWANMHEIPFSKFRKPAAKSI